MPSQPVVALALVIVALALVLVVGTVGSTWLSRHAEKVDVRIGAVQMVRALSDRLPFGGKCREHRLRARNGPNTHAER
jgi:hypothetical protein